MQFKVALEEHWEAAEFDAIGSHEFTDADYFAEVQRRLREVDQRVEDMDRNGIGISILSLTQPGIEGVTDTRQAVDLARRMNDHAAENQVSGHPERLRAFAAVPLQDPEKAADELERAVQDLGFVGAMVNGYSNIGDEDTAQYLDEPQVEPFWARVEKLGVPSVDSSTATQASTSSSATSARRCRSSCPASNTGCATSVATRMAPTRSPPWNTYGTTSI